MSDKELKRARKRAMQAIQEPVPSAAGSQWYDLAPELLENLVLAIAACEDAGLAITLAHGAVITEAGYVLKIGQEWVVRTRRLTEFGVPDSSEEPD